MSASTVCPHCGAEHTVNPNRAGQRLRCPACEQLFDITLGRPEPPPVPVAVAEPILAASIQPQPPGPLASAPPPAVWHNSPPQPALSPAAVPAAAPPAPPSLKKLLGARG